MMSASTTELPPNPPPLPPNRAGLLQRITAPFNLGTRTHGSHSTHSSGASPRDLTAGNIYKPLPSQTTVHRTGIPISALDVNKDKTHVILAGQEILKTVRIEKGKAVEDFNLRSAVNASGAFGPKADAANHRREFLPAKDVRWSHGDHYDHIIATAAVNGRISLYDVSRISSSRVELEWIHHHTGQVNKLDFDPVGGYLLLSGSQDKTVKLWDIRNPKSAIKKQSFNIRHPIRDIKWSPTDVGEFALCTESGIVQRWDLRNPSQALLSINAHEKACYTIDWHPDGRHLVSGGLDKYVRVWDFKSENRRQKPAFQLRTPQAVMNLRWRPPCWSSEATQTGHWQCTQLATGYTDDDPRVHVWDLRRPLIPFRELDRHNSRPTDLLWASKDFLWTVGNEGMFTQTDIRYAAQVHDELPPCALQFTPTGELVTFTEDMRPERMSSHDDPAAKFLRVPPERLSGATDETASRVASDEELEDGPATLSSRRRQSKAASSRSAKSQGNTPPNLDGFPSVMSLDRSILGRRDLFNNEQVGLLSTVDGVTTDPQVVAFLANHYARPSSVEERKQEPAKILQRMQIAFEHNADACERVSLHRMAQSWRILCAVVIPELQDWADGHRRKRLELEKSVGLPSTKLLDRDIELSSRAQTPTQLMDVKISQRPPKVVSNLFKGVMASEAITGEPESSSGMTTPLAMPLPDSPRSKHGDENVISLNGMSENLAPLPPSVVGAHATAAAASKALAADHSHRRTSSFTLRKSTDSHSLHEHRSPDVNLRTQEDRRAAIRDYRAQARPLFTLEAPVQSPRYDNPSQRDSADSFPMFSASTDSSNKLDSVPDSYVSPGAPARVRHDSQDRRRGQQRESFGSSPPSHEATQSQSHHYFRDARVSRQDSIESAIEDAPGFSFGADGETSMKVPAQPKVTSSTKIWDIRDLDPPPPRDHQEPDTTASSASDGVFQFEQASSVPKPRIYSSNPIRRLASQTETATLRRLKEQDLDVKYAELPSEDYVYSDFRPVDFTIYEPQLPFAWSALPLVCHTIAYDLVEGPACAQFAVHLLLHLHPFFFNQAFRHPLVSSVPAPDNMAERLMRPDLSHRLIEGLFLAHVRFLQRLGLYGPMAELKNHCVEFDYPGVFKPGQTDHAVGTTLTNDAYTLQMSCPACHIILPGETTTCINCQATREVCPICLALDLPPTTVQKPLSSTTSLWTACQMCGHGGHFSCMHEWFLLPGVGGACASAGCGCDCGPGLRRDERMARQATDSANHELIRGSRTTSNMTKRDVIRAVPSPAVDKVRDTLRYADLSDRGNRSNDETSRRTFTSQGGRDSRASVSGVGSRGPESQGSRRVRLITPGEQGKDRDQHPT